MYVVGQDVDCPVDGRHLGIGRVGAGYVRIVPLSMPMSVYIDMDPKILRFRGGVMVASEDAAQASGTLNAATLPAGEAMHVMHVGPYDNLGDTHKAMWDHMKTQGINGTMPVWEIYVDEPGVVAPDALRTEIYCAIG